MNPIDKAAYDAAIDSVGKYCKYTHEVLQKQRLLIEALEEIKRNDWFGTENKKQYGYCGQIAKNVLEKITTL